ncbi:MAG: sirohydrochlorin chelatase [Gammaproteobacteria bacterium]
MNSLILIAHGSRLASSNEEIIMLTECLQEKLADDYFYISHAFLELAEPSIPRAIDMCMDLDTRRIDLFPYFLTAGKHTTQDIPAVVEQAMQKYPGVDYEIKNYLGMLKGITDMIAETMSN